MGEAFRLTPKDLTFGSHRSHGEILAKGLRSIEIMEEGELLSVMEGFFGGKTYGVIKDEGKSLREQGIDFLLYGMMCETFARENGFNKGLGGSMHAFFTPLGIYPNNAIVGGSGTISVGAALYKLVNDKEGVVVCNIGDGSTACGPVWEGFMLAAMDQIKLLWPEGKHALPIIFNINDNFYGMGGQTRGETMGYDMVARIAAGISPGRAPCGAHRRLQPARCYRRIHEEAARCKERGPGAAGCSHLPHKRPQPLRFLQLQDEGGDRGMAGAGLHNRLRQTACGGRRMRRSRACRDTGKGGGGYAPQHEAGHRRRGFPEDRYIRRGKELHRRSHVLQRLRPLHGYRAQARYAAAQGGVPPHTADSQEKALLSRRKRQARAQGEGISVPRRHSRAHNKQAL